MYNSGNTVTENDEFEKFYNQYRPKMNKYDYSPTPSSYYSTYSSGYGRYGQDDRSDKVTDSYSSSDTYSSATFNRNGTVYKSYPSTYMMPRSRSHGRDLTLRSDLASNLMTSRPRTADTEHHYHHGPGHEDNISRDSGHSSAGTPEFAKKHFNNNNSSINNNSRDVYTRPDEWYYRSRLNRKFQHDTYSLCDTRYGTMGQDQVRTAQYSDGLSVQSLDLRNGVEERYCEDNRPPIMPRKSLIMSQQKREVSRFRENRELQEKVDEENKQHQQKIKNTAILVFTISIITASGCILWCTHRQQMCDDKNAIHWDIQALKMEMYDKIVGQNPSLDKIFINLSNIASETKSASPLFEVLLLLGSSGVGKTYVVDIIEKHFPIKENIHHIEDYQSIGDLPRTILRSCGYSLIIIDDLEEDDRMRIQRLEKMIISLSQQEESQSKGILIIINTRAGEDIINDKVLEDTKDNLALRENINIDDLKKAILNSGISIPLQSNLKDYSLPVQVIPFLPLTRDNVRECTQKLFLEKNVVIKQYEVNAIVDQLSFFSLKHPIYAKHGCKPIATKTRNKLQKKQEL